MTNRKIVIIKLVAIALSLIGIALTLSGNMTAGALTATAAFMLYNSAP